MTIRNIGFVLFLFITICSLFFITSYKTNEMSNGNSRNTVSHSVHNSKNGYTDGSGISPTIQMKTPKPAQRPTPPRTVTDILDHVQETLVAKHNIQVTTDEIRDYLQKTVGDNVTDFEFQETIIQLDALVAAADSLFTENLTPKEAAQTYLSKGGEVSPHDIEWLRQINSYEQVEKIKKMLSKNVEDAIEKSLSGNRKIVEKHKLAEILLPSSERKGPEIHWNWRLYNQILLNYAKENLIHRFPELQNITPDEFIAPPTPIPTLQPHTSKPVH